MNGGNESAQIPPRGENVFHWDRGDIEDAFTPLDSTNAHDVAMEYSNVATSWDQGLETFARSVSGSIAEAWEGAAADQAKAAITRYTTDAHNLTTLLTQMSNDMQAASRAISDTRNAIPPAAAHSWTTNVYPPRAHEEERSRNEARDGARTAMQEHYVRTFAELDGRVPVLPTALDPTQPLDISSPGPGTTTDTGRTSSRTGDDPGGSGQPGTSDPGEQPTADESGDQSGETTSDTDTSTDSQTTPSNVTANAPTSTTTEPSSTPSTTPSSTPSTTPSSTPGPGSPTSPGVPGRDHPGTPSPGRSIPGVAGTGTPTSTSQAATAATASGSRGTAGMPGMMGGGRGKSDEDSTHTTPDYLINAENTAELLGEIPRTVPDGVIGGDRDTGSTGAG